MKCLSCETYSQQPLIRTSKGTKNLFELVNVRINERILQKYLIKRNENMIRISESLNYRGLELTDVDCTSPVPLRITSLAMIEILPSCLS